MTIAVGTLCLLIGAYPLAGRCCTVTAPLALRYTDVGWEDVYKIDIPGEQLPPGGLFFCAWPSQLLPIAPPGVLDDTDTTTTKREPAVA